MTPGDGVSRPGRMQGGPDSHLATDTSGIRAALSLARTILVNRRRGQSRIRCASGATKGELEELTDSPYAGRFSTEVGVYLSPARRACRKGQVRGRAARGLRELRAGKGVARGGPVVISMRSPCPRSTRCGRPPRRRHGWFGCQSRRRCAARCLRAVVARALAQIAAAGLGHRFGQTQGCARRGVALGAMVCFHDLDVVGRAQNPGRVRTKRSITFTPTDMLAPAQWDFSACDAIALCPAPKAQ